MKCASCSVANPKASKFCGNCGASLNFERPVSKASAKLRVAVNGDIPKPGFEYRNIVIGFTSVFLLIAIGIFVSLSGSNNETQPAQPKAPEISSVEETEIPVVSTETIGEENAKKKAESYLSFSGFSKKSLINQLKYEGFTAAEATYAVENIVVNWDEQAARKAEEYMRFQAFSANGLIGQLIYEGFTDKQAAYGAYMVGFRP
jgi:hypothetical protein